MRPGDIDSRTFGKNLKPMADTQHILGNLSFPRTRWALAGFVAGIFAWSFAGGGQQRTAESKNEGTVGAIDGTVQRLSQGIRDATANVRGGLSDVGNKANHMSLRSKVTARLGKEGSIDDDRIEVEIKDEGTVVLSGQVPDAADKEMAVRIASATDGVIRVEDRLSVPADLRVFTSKPEDNAPVPRRTR
jgi:hypothetical protein